MECVSVALTYYIYKTNYPVRCFKFNGSSNTIVSIIRTIVTTGHIIGNLPVSHRYANAYIS